MTSLNEFKAHRKELKAQIKEAKALLHRLEEQLEDERHDMQHEEVDHLDEYLNKSEPHFSDFKKLGITAVDDFRDAMRKLIQSLGGSQK